MTPTQPTAIEIDTTSSSRRPMRIALVTETYPPEVNGVAVTIAQVVAGLRERKHDVQLVRPRQGRHDGADRADATREMLVRGVPIPRYPHLRMGLPARQALVRQWTQVRPDVVHVATEGPLGWSALLAARQLGLPVTSDFRTNFHTYCGHYGLGWLSQPIAAYLRTFHNRACCTMVPTEALRQELEAQGFQRTLVVARGVDTQHFHPGRRSEALRRSWKVAPTDPVVLYVGRLAPEKNLDTLLLVVEAMRCANTALKLVIVGDGPLRDELRARCPQAVFVGQRSGADLATHYASADMFVFPSLTETFGNVTPEAMASGLPVLAFDYAAASQLIGHGENGRLAPFGDRGAFLAQALALVRDPGAARTLGQAARLSAMDLSWDHIVRQIETVFIAAMIGQRTPRPVSSLVAEWDLPY